jgi:hypothetical protein
VTAKTPAAGTEMLATLRRLAAAFNGARRLTITLSQVARIRPVIYTNAITNDDARIGHATTIDGRGCAFPYDDVALPGR